MCSSVRLSTIGPCWGIQHMNPDKGMENPACGWRLGGFTFLVEKRGSMSLERGANTVFEGRIDQETHRHHHKEGHNALRLFEIER